MQPTSPFQVVMQFVLTILLAILFGSIYWKLRERAQKLPEHQRLALEQFASLAVRKVEQVSGNLSPEAKKSFAMAAISQLCLVFKLPVFPDVAMDIAIEAAVLLLPKSEPPKGG